MDRQSQPKTFKHGFQHLLFLITCFFISHYDKKETPRIEKTNKQILFINKDNYDKILRQNWILIVKLKDQRIDMEKIKKVNEYCNVAILKAKDIFQCKIISVLKPKQNNTYFLMSNGNFINKIGEIKNIGAFDVVSAMDVIEYYFLHKIDLLFRFIRLIISKLPLESKFYILMFIFEFYMGLFVKSSYTHFLQ